MNVKMAFFIGFILALALSCFFFWYISYREKKELSKMKSFYKVLVKWLMIKQRNITIDSFFSERNMKRIVIYGMKELGELLYRDLKDTEIHIVQLVDKDADKMYVDADMKLSHPDSLTTDADVIVVTAISEFGRIKEDLKEKTRIPIVSLSQVTGSYKLY